MSDAKVSQTPEHEAEQFLPRLRKLLEEKVDSFDSGIGLDDAVIQVVGALANHLDKPAARQLALDWIGSHGISKQTVLDRSLARSQNETTRCALLDLGANPNGWIPNQHGYEVTALAEAYMHSLVEPVLSDLRVLAQRDELPLYSRKEAKPGARRKNKAKNLFEKLVEDDSQNGFWMKKQVLDGLLAMDLPESWRLAAGQALLKYLPKKGVARYSEKFNADIGLLAIAAFETPEEWRLILSCGEDKELPHAIASISWKLPAQVEAIAKHVIAAGIHPDEVATSYQQDDGHVCVCTWLKSAVQCNNAALVQQLLEAGADPMNTYPPRAIGTIVGEELDDAFATAAKHNANESLKVLEAWRAKKAVDSIIKRNQTENRP